MNPKPAHAALEPIKFLLGTWRSISAHGKFAERVAPFVYCEQLEFTTCGQPMLNYTSTSWHAVDKYPMHMETGFMRIIPNTNNVNLFLAHNFGLTTIEEGFVVETSLKLKSTSVSRSPNVKTPKVLGIERNLTLLDDGKLQLVLYMSTNEVPEMTQHLAVIYEKVIE